MFFLAVDTQQSQAGCLVARTENISKSKTMASSNRKGKGVLDRALSRGKSKGDVIRQVKEQELTPRDPRKSEYANPLRSIPGAHNSEESKALVAARKSFAGTAAIMLGMDEFEDDDDGPIVEETNDVNDVGVQHVVKHGGAAEDYGHQACRRSLRFGEHAYDVIISNDVIKLTWASVKFSMFAGQREWNKAYSKYLFPEHITEIDHYAFEVTHKGKLDIAMCSCRCPRIALPKVSCCKFKCPRYEGKKLIAPKQVEPCVCELPKCGLCAGLNPLTACLYVALLCYCFALWYLAMVNGVNTGVFSMLESIKYQGYCVAALTFLLLCEMVTLRNLEKVETETIRVAEEDEAFHEVWEQHMHPDTGHSYYYNRERNKTEWEIPIVEGVMEGDSTSSEKRIWIKKSDDKGDVVFHDPVTDEVRLEHPGEAAESKKKARRASHNPDPFGDDEKFAKLAGRLSNKEDVVDNGVEPGGKAMGKVLRNVLSVEAIKENVRNHRKAAMLTCCTCIWHLVFVLLIAGATLSKPYNYEGKRRLAVVSNKSCLIATPIPPAILQGKIWCDPDYWNMEQGTKEKGLPYYKCSDPKPPAADPVTPAPIPKCDRSDNSPITYPTCNCGQSKCAQGTYCWQSIVDNVCHTTKLSRCKTSDSTALDLTADGGCTCRTSKNVCKGNQFCWSSGDDKCNSRKYYSPCATSDTTALGGSTTPYCQCGTGYNAICKNGQYCWHGGNACTTTAKTSSTTKPPSAGACPRSDTIAIPQNKNQCQCGTNTKFKCKAGSYCWDASHKDEACKTDKYIPPAPEKPKEPDWWCPSDDRDAAAQARDWQNHLHRASKKCGHCNDRFMAPWVWVMLALLIEIILMLIVAGITADRKRLGRVTKGRFVKRKITPAQYEKAKLTKGGFQGISISGGGVKKGEFIPGRFRYIEPRTVQLAKVVFADREKRKWTVYLTQEDAMDIGRTFFRVQNQKHRQTFQSHSAPRVGISMF